MLGSKASSRKTATRLGDWLKIKCIQSDRFAIVGYEKSTASFGVIGRLLLAARKGGEFVYVGGVGTGFNERSASELREQMDRLTIAKPAVDTEWKRKRGPLSSQSSLPRLNIASGRMKESCDTRHIRGCVTLLMRLAFMRFLNASRR